MTGEEMGTKDRFDLLFDSLGNHAQHFVDMAFKVAGMLLLVAGWMMTSNDARAFLARDDFARNGTLIGIVAIAVLFAVTCWQVYASSHRTFELLKKLDYVEVPYLERRLIKMPLFVIVIAANICISSWLFSLVYRTQSEAAPRPATIELKVF